MSQMTQLATTLPALRWCGWRPDFLKHERDERAGHLLLVLEREGDTMLLPCAQVAYCFAFPAWEAWEEADALRRVWGDGADSEMMEQAVSQLEADGWRVVGRLLVEFTGIDAEASFWPAVRAVLRKTGATVEEWTR